MSSFEDTRHVVQGSTGGSTDDTTAYNDVLAAGSTLTFTSINGDQKQVSVTGGGGSVQAFNNASGAPQSSPVGLFLRLLLCTR